MTTKNCLDFDAQVQLIRASGIKPKSTCKPKNQCTPQQWAANLEWRAAYYQTHKKEWDGYRNRWLAKKSKNEVLA